MIAFKEINEEMDQRVEQPITQDHGKKVRFQWQKQVICVHEEQKARKDEIGLMMAEKNSWS